MSSHHERRSGNDRRQEDIVSAGKMERRRAVESRKLEIIEVQLSNADWELLFGDAKGTAIPSFEASAIFGRSRH